MAHRRRFLKIALLLFGLAALGAGVFYGYPLVADRHGEDGHKSAIEYWTCSMHRFIREPEPGPCPICATTMVPVYKEQPSEIKKVPADAGTVIVSAEETRLLGIRTVAAARGSLSTKMRTVGRVVPDEKRIHHIHTKISGWVEELFIDRTGERVRQGQPMLTIYSPALVSAQEEYLIAYRAVEKLGGSSSPDAADGSRALLGASRSRLLLWGVSSVFIEELERTHEVRRTVPLFAEAGGVVLERNVTSGQQIAPMDDLFVLADLDRVWVLADIYPREISYVREGQAVEVELTGLPGQTFHGTVSYVYPYMDETSRTNRIRIELPNPKGHLRPGMYGDVAITVPDDSALLVPQDAVLVTGRRQVVFIDVGEGKYVPREVEIGRQNATHLEILSGIKEGDIVVERANFFLDAESQLRPGSAMEDHDHGAASRTAGESAPSGAASRPTGHGATH